MLLAGINVQRRRRSPCRSRALLLLLAVVLCPLVPAQGQQAVRIGFVTDGPSERTSIMQAEMQAELSAVLDGEFMVSFPAAGMHQGDWTLAGLQRAVDAALADGDIDVLITLGVGASIDVARRGPLPLPVLAPQLIDAQTLDIIGEDQTSTVTNLSFVTFDSRGPDVLDAFADLADVHNVVVLVHELYREMLAHIPEAIVPLGPERGMVVRFVWISGGPQQILDAVPDDADGIVLAPTYHLSNDESRQLAQGFIGRGLPSFSLFGRSEVELGHLATLAADSDAQRLARRTALNIQRILLGDAPEDIPVQFERSSRLAINIATARAIKVWPRFDLLVDAELINPDPEPVGKELNIVSAVHEALSMNLDLIAIDHFVAAGIEDVQATRAALYPQIDALLGATAIDKDRAASSAGQTARRTWEAAVRIDQLVWSEPTLADVDISELTQEARVWLRQELILDVTQATAVAYLDVLRNKTLQRIRRDDTALTRSNLELAQTRRRIGVADRSEVYRWESQLASSQRSLVRTRSQLRVSEILLNRLLHRSLGESLRVVETGLEDTALFPEGGRLKGFIDDPWSIAVFEDFMVDRGQSNSPELRQIELEEDIGQRIVESRDAAYWSPTAGFFLEGRRAIHRGGNFASPALFGNPDRDSWTAALSVSFPLYTGGARPSLLRQAMQDRARLMVERSATAERIEQGVRSSMQLTTASYTSIRLSEKAATAAQNNLELVRDAYGRGVLSILDLLDAQSSALTADLESASAMYDFLIDLMNVQRAAGEFHVFLNATDMAQWEAEVVDALQRAGVSQN